jgi:hypothetical protein
MLDHGRTRRFLIRNATIPHEIGSDCRREQCGAHAANSAGFWFVRIILTKRGSPTRPLYATRNTWERIAI